MTARLTFASRRKDRAASVALSPLGGKATLGALRCFHSQQVPAFSTSLVWVLQALQLIKGWWRDCFSSRRTTSICPTAACGSYYTDSHPSLHVLTGASSTGPRGLAFTAELLMELPDFRWLIATSAVEVVHHPPLYPRGLVILVIWAKLVSWRQSLATESTSFSAVESDKTV